MAGIVRAARIPTCSSRFPAVGLSLAGTSSGQHTVSGRAGRAELTAAEAGSPRARPSAHASVTPDGAPRGGGERPRLTALCVSDRGRSVAFSATVGWG